MKMLEADISKTVSGGLSLSGKRWDRPDDVVGLAVAINDASAAAKRFFAAGGLGILVGDGQLLHSGPEKIAQSSATIVRASAAASWAVV